CLGFIIDYWVGFLMGPKVFRKLWGDKYDKFERKLNRVGSYLIIGGNIFYFPMQLLSVFFGGMRYSFIKFAAFSFIGKLAQYVLIFFGYKYSREYVVPFFIQAIIPWAMYMWATYAMPVIELFRVV
ncbi:hypothetical protein GF351_01765, partial [Candidatus Woesearchaeota archaeon]|nr:hypothetical protein [Candidatus Woesearchaeota archaeon]